MGQSDNFGAPRLRIYATLPRSSAYVGNFSHAPSAGKNAFFDSEITRVEELERLHRIRAHPFTGNFHSRPGHYSKLHGLAKFRDEQDDGMREPAQRKRILDRIRSTLTEPFATSSGADAAAGFVAAPKQVSRRPSVASSAWAAAATAAANGNGNGRGPPNGFFSGEDELVGATTTMLRHFYHLPNGGGDAGGGGVARQQGASPNAEAVAMRWAARGGPSPRVAAMAAAARSRDTHNRNPMAQPKHGRGYGSVPSAAAASAAAPPNGSFVPPASRGGMGLRASIGPGCRVAGSSGAGGRANCPSHGWESHTVRAQQKTEAFLTQREQLAPDMRPSIVLEKEVSDSYDVDLSEEGRLGRGAYSDVHAAVHRATGRPVAIKAIQKRYLFSDADKAAVEREISLQQRLVHEHIARLYETYDTPDHIYLVMERAPLGTLEELLFVRGRMPELEAKRVTKQVLEAVTFCHNSGVVHCDLKPANVLLTDALYPADGGLSPRGGSSSNFSSTAAGKTADEEAAAAATRRSMVAAGEVLSVVGAVVKICDFGHSCKVPDVRYYKYTNDINRIPFHLFKHTGTEGFVAPEILDAEPYGKPADLWSIGVMLAVMLVGRLPFVGTRASQQEQQRPAQQLEGPLWRGVSAEAKSLVGALLELNPDLRPTAAEALRHAWFDQVDHCVVLPFPPRQRSTSGNASDVEYVAPRRRGSSVASNDTGRR